MVEVTTPARDTYLVHTERPPWGKNKASGVAVYNYRNGTWLCEKCGTPEGTSRKDCIHIAFVKDSLEP
jgi:hypothetical protein